MYVPGFSPTLLREEYGGPAYVGALPVPQVANVQPTAPPIMTATAAPTNAPYIPTVRPRLRGAAYTPQDMMNAGFADERTMDDREDFRRADPSFTRRISDQNAYYTEPESGFFYNDDASRVGHYFTTNRGGAATAEGASGFAEFNPNAQYRLVNRRDGNSVVYSGTGREGLIGVQGAAQQFAQNEGDDGDWAVEQMDPTSGQWSTVARDTRPSNIAGLIADIALPVAGAILLPGVGGALGGALGAGLGAAGGSALSSVAQGRSLGDTLLRAGLSGVAAGGLSAVGGAPFLGASGGAGGVGGAAAGSAAGANIMGNAGLQLAGLAPGNILVQGTAGALGAGLGAAGGGVLGAGLGSAVGGALTGATGGSTPTATQPEGNILVTGTPSGGVNPVVPVVGAGAGVGSALAAGGGGATPNPVVPETIGNPIEVTADPNAPAAIDAATAASVAGGVLPTGGILPSGQTPTQSTETLESGDGLGLDEIINYLRAGSLGAGLIGNLLEGGGGQQGVGTIPGGLNGGLSGAFSGGLGAPTLPGASGNFAQRPADMDWKRYGYGPSQSFFNYVPQGQPNTSQAYTGYAEGGEVSGGMPLAADSFAVEGAGTGRSDEIPALLSDGEYVFDAETVALLGDGSTKAGADALDQFRVNIRKHKGAKLAKGNFSPNAKAPEHYLKGGRT